MEKENTNVNKKKNRSLIIGIIVGFVVLVGGVVGGGIYYYMTYLTVHEIEAEAMNLEIGTVTPIDAMITPSSHMNSITYEVVKGQSHIMVDGEGMVTVKVALVPEGEELAQVKIAASNGVEKVIDIILNNVEITVPEEKIILELSETYQLTPTMSPAETALPREFTYSTSDQDVFTVGADGVIMADILENGGQPRTAIATISTENGLEKQVEVEVRDTFYSDISTELREYTNYDSGYIWTGNTAVFVNEIPNCTGLSLSHLLADNGSYTGEVFEVYGITSAGQWTLLGSFAGGAVNTFTNVDIAFAPITLKEVAIIPRTKKGEWSHSYWFTGGTY